MGGGGWGGGNGERPDTTDLYSLDGNLRALVTISIVDKM